MTHQKALTKTQKGKYLVMLHEEGELCVLKGCALFDYLVQCGYYHEYGYTLAGFENRPTFRFLPQIEKHTAKSA